MLESSSFPRVIRGNVRCHRTKSHRRSHHQRPEQSDHLHPCELRLFPAEQRFDHVCSVRDCWVQPAAAAGAESRNTGENVDHLREPGRQIADSLMQSSRHRTSSTRIRNSPQPLTSRRNHHKMSAMSKPKSRNSWNRYGIPAANPPPPPFRRHVCVSFTKTFD